MATSSRKLSQFDHWLISFDRGLKAILDSTTFRINPAEDIAETSLDTAERKKSAGLMRVNHVGEICAQSLYQGQALTTRDRQTQTILLQSAEEEVDHLVWCRERLEELHSHTSYLNIVWYSGSFLMGMVFGLFPTATNLGFVAETEHQVMKHLEGHLQTLPEKDLRSRAILEQMYQDEQHHATQAIQSGGESLPGWVKALMKAMSKVMTTVAFWV